MQMAAGMDTGDILTQRTIPIAEDETGGGLFDKLSALGAELIVETLPKLERGEIIPVPQDEDRATKCGKLSKDMGRIHWSDDADKLRNLVRGLNPWPSAYTSLNKKSFKIWRAKALMELEFRQMAKELGDGKDGIRAKALDDKAYGTVMAVLRDSLVVLTGDGYLQLFEVQLEGKKRMPVKDFLMGYKLEVGAKLGD